MGEGTRGIVTLYENRVLRRLKRLLHDVLIFDSSMPNPSLWKKVALATDSVLWEASMAEARRDIRAGIHAVASPASIAVTDSPPYQQQQHDSSLNLRPFN